MNIYHRQTICIKCKGIYYPEAIRNLVSNIYIQWAPKPLQCLEILDWGAYDAWGCGNHAQRLKNQINYFILAFR